MKIKESVSKTRKIDLINFILCVGLAILMIVEMFVPIKYSNILWSVWFISWGIEYIIPKKEKVEKLKEDEC